MERSALYRRALAPLMIFAGALGVAGALMGRWLAFAEPQGFVAYWYGVAAVGLIGGFLMVRRQAWQQSEPFWSPPMRRVAQAVLPPLTAGFVLGVLIVLAARGFTTKGLVVLGLPLAWSILYGCALHAAGFFMTRGMRLFGWVFIVGGCVAAFVGYLAGEPGTDAGVLNAGYGLMGLFFGLLQLAYGVYLYFTEPRRDET